jgi:hypothetical protein
MTANRANWYETFESYVLFYPKLSAAIALGSMAAAGRMIPTNSRAIGDTAATLVETTPSIPLSPARRTKKRATSRKSPKGRKRAKRSTVRRKAA